MIARVLCTLFIAFIATTALAADPPLSANRAIYLYQGPDRDKQLVEKAKKEGKLSFYSTMTISDAHALTTAFEKKYGIKVNTWRGSDEKIMQRAVAEARAGHYDTDVFEMNSSQVENLYREDLLEEFYVPGIKDIPANAIPKHRHYFPDRLAFFVMAYNTNLVKPADVPNNYEDLLNPKWIGKFGIEASDVLWFAAVVKSMGEEKGMAYFQKLAAMKPEMRSSHILVAQLVAAGEVPMVLSAYVNNAESLKKTGAPIAWKALQPAIGQASAIALAKNSPRPHAALLFAEFVLSPEGQQIIKEVNRAPASMAVDSPMIKFKYELIDPGMALDESDKWSALFSNLFLGGKAVPKGE
ncbi:MAG TPA: extracellular solute-binding protein [Herbaspirillum sp.]|jgi:iron(III) transport system substrate-binding protein